MRARRGPPTWTGFNRSDPGLSLAGLFGFLGEQIGGSPRRRHLATVGAALALGLLWWSRRSGDG